MCCIVRASGNFDKVDWFRAFDTGKRKAGTKSLGCNEYLHLCGGRGLGEILYIQSMNFTLLAASLWPLAKVLVQVASALKRQNKLFLNNNLANSVELLASIYCTV